MVTVEGVCGGTAVVDECGVCEGDGPEENFDCDGNCIVEIDCNGVCGGDAYLIDYCLDTDGDGLGNPGTEVQECIDGDSNQVSRDCDSDVCLSLMVQI